MFLVAHKNRKISANIDEIAIWIVLLSSLDLTVLEFAQVSNNPMDNKTCPTEHFTILEPWIDKFYVPQKRRSTEFIAPKVGEKYGRV